MSIMASRDPQLWEVAAMWVLPSSALECAQSESDGKGETLQIISTMADVDRFLNDLQKQYLDMWGNEKGFDMRASLSTFSALRWVMRRMVASHYRFWPFGNDDASFLMWERCPTTDVAQQEPSMLSSRTQATHDRMDI